MKHCLGYETLPCPAILMDYEMEELLHCMANHIILKFRKCCFCFCTYFTVLFGTVMFFAILLPLLKNENE